jgi:hypothetical protein
MEFQDVDEDQYFNYKNNIGKYLIISNAKNRAFRRKTNGKIKPKMKNKAKYSYKSSKRSSIMMETNCFY